MKNKLRENKAITLIALVITIIVLLILAGIAISMLSGENGILNQAAKAKSKTDEKSLEEQVKLAVTGAMANKNHKVNKEDLKKELENYGFEINKDTLKNEDKWIVTKNEKKYEITLNGEVTLFVTEPPVERVSEKTKFQDSKSENKIAVIPKGFRVSNVTGEKTEQEIDKGLVVIAPDESEFVWIPVTAPMYEEQNGRKVGILYNNGDINNQIAYSNNGNREPDILKGTKYGDLATKSSNSIYKDEEIGINALKNIIGLNGKNNNEIEQKWTKQLQNEFEEMIKYVKKAGGFYVGRYETSWSKNKAQSKRNCTSATLTSEGSRTWYGLYQIEKEYAKKNGITNIIGSSMIWGSQYDQMMIWMKSNDIDVMSTSLPKNKTQITGNEGDTDVLLNVYDLAGCNVEWTLEANGEDHRIGRRRMV